LYGFSHNIVTRQQYSFLVEVAIASAVIPTLIAGLFFFPRHLLPAKERTGKPLPSKDEWDEEG
jgi:glutathione-regulated potassium-efflux system ancillary protein KefC